MQAPLSQAPLWVALTVLRQGSNCRAAAAARQARPSEAARQGDDEYLRVDGGSTATKPHLPQKTYGNYEEEPMRLWYGKVSKPFRVTVYGVVGVEILLALVAR